LSNSLRSLLITWSKSRDDYDWVLGTIYKTEGSAYRKAGSHMLINSLGQQYGLLSGGCLESDIVRNSRRVMDSGEPITLIYDSNDEDDIAFQFGLGCGGKVYIMLQLITKKNYLCLDEVLKALNSQKSGLYHQKIASKEVYFEINNGLKVTSNRVEKRDDGDWLVSKIIPEPHVLLVGGGLDAKPFVRLAKELSWIVTVVDPRVANARPENFSTVDFIVRKIDERLLMHIRNTKVRAAIIMSHNLKIDADFLLKIQSINLDYVALLGPKHRFKEVLTLAGLSEKSLRHPVSSPAGLDIGGELPESVALSILSECHGVLFKKIILD